MTLNDIDEALTDWQAKLEVVNANLVALARLPAYERLRGKPAQPTAGLVGASGAQAGRARERASELWSHYSLLTATIERAVVLRRAVSRFRPSGQTLDDIERLLREPIGALAVEALQPVRDGRSKGAGSPASMTLEDLLAAMRRSFQEVRDVVVALDGASNRLTAVLAELEAEAAALNQQAEALGEEALPELAAAGARLASLRDLVDSDPLAVALASDELRTALEQVRSRLETLAGERDQLPADLAAAQQLLAQLETCHGQAKQAFAESAAKVSELPAELPRPLEDEAVAALRPWLAKLEATRQAGKWKPAVVGIRKWTAAARQYLAAEEQTRAANEAPVRERRDLRGLLDALKAKARSNGRAEDAEAAALAQEAWQLLSSRPTPLDRARRLVADYQARQL